MAANAATGQQHRGLPRRGRRVEGRPQRLHERLQLAGGHRQLPVVRRAGQRFQERGFPIGRQRNQRNEPLRPDVGIADLASQPNAHMRHDRRHGSGRGAAGFLHPFEDRRQIPHRHAFGQQRLQHPLDAANSNLGRNQIVDQFPLFARQFVQQFLSLRMRQQFGEVLPHQFRQMRGQNARRIDNGATSEQGFLFQFRFDPQRRQSEGRFARFLPLQSRGRAAGIHGEQPRRAEFPFASLDFLDADHVFVGW